MKNLNIILFAALTLMSACNGAGSVNVMLPTSSAATSPTPAVSATFTSTASPTPTSTPSPTPVPTPSIVQTVSCSGAVTNGLDCSITAQAGHMVLIIGDVANDPPSITLTDAHNTWVNDVT